MFLKGYDIDVKGRAETLRTDVATLKVIKLVKLCRETNKVYWFPAVGMGMLLSGLVS